MQNKVPSGSDNVNVISFDDSDYRDEVIDGNDQSDSATIDSETGTNEDFNDIDNGEEEFRMRGGCGGGGGSGCGCGTNRVPDYTRQSSCGMRYQSEKSSTIEGACGCGASGSGGYRASAGGGYGASGGGGCGSSTKGCCGGRTHGISSSHTSQNVGHCGTTRDDEGKEGHCASKFGGSYRPRSREICSLRPPDPCSPDPAGLSACSTVACSPPCSERKGCCPPAGHRPDRRRKQRCDAPCTGDTQGCGGGGCCGGGCRGGCGKPGQTCLPLRPCTIPPCQPQPRGGGSPCLPPRDAPPQPPCCRPPAIPGRVSAAPGAGGNGGSSCCRSKSPGTRTAGGGGGCCSGANAYQLQDEPDFCCQSKLPPGCECLGGGQDCQRCGRKVYQAEMQVVSGAPYHNICFSCFCCRKPLETLTYHENCGEIYCKQCYVRNFGPQGYGYAGVLQTPM